jgi:hypothetical protein
MMVFVEELPRCAKLPSGVLRIYGPIRTDPVQRSVGAQRDRLAGDRKDAAASPVRTPSVSNC